MKMKKNLYFIPHRIVCMQLLFYMFSTLISLKDRLRLKLKVKTEISLCMAIMLDRPWQSLYTQYYLTISTPVKVTWQSHTHDFSDMLVFRVGRVVHWTECS